MAIVLDTASDDGSLRETEAVATRWARDAACGRAHEASRPCRLERRRTNCVPMPESRRRSTAPTASKKRAEKKKSSRSGSRRL